VNVFVYKKTENLVQLQERNASTRQRYRIFIRFFASAYGFCLAFADTENLVEEFYVGEKTLHHVMC